MTLTPQRLALANVQTTAVEFRELAREVRSVGILDYDENLGRELDATVRTGTFCAYEPDPRRPIKWTVEDG